VIKPLHHIIVRPMLTEKSVRSNEQKKYTFVVALDASKPEIATAIETIYAKEKIKVEVVHTMHMRGKKRRNLGKSGRRGGTGMSPAWKKAIVTLTADSPTIPMLEGA